MEPETTIVETRECDFGRSWPSPRPFGPSHRDRKTAEEVTLAGLLTCASSSLELPSQTCLQWRVQPVLALRAYSYGVVAELHRASRTPWANEIYIGIKSWQSNEMQRRKKTGAGFRHQKD